MPINKKFFLLPVPLKMHFLPPVSSGDKTVSALKEEVFNAMLREYVEGIRNWDLEKSFRI